MNRSYKRSLKYKLYSHYSLILRLWREETALARLSLQLQGVESALTKVRLSEKSMSIAHVLPQLLRNGTPNGNISELNSQGKEAFYDQGC